MITKLRLVLLTLLAVSLLPAQRLTKIIHLSHIPGSGPMNLTDNKLYVQDACTPGHGPEYKMSVIDCLTDSVIKVLPVGVPAGGIFGWTSRCDKLWKYERNQYIKVFDAHADTLLDSIYSPLVCPGGWGYDPTVGKLYVCTVDCVEVFSEDRDSLLEVLDYWGAAPFFSPIDSCDYWMRVFDGDTAGRVDVRKGKNDTLTYFSIPPPVPGAKSFGLGTADTIRGLLLGGCSNTPFSGPVVYDCARESVLAWWPGPSGRYLVAVNSPYHKLYCEQEYVAQIRILDYLSGDYRDVQFTSGQYATRWQTFYDTYSNRLYIAIDSAEAADWLYALDGAADTLLFPECGGLGTENHPDSLRDRRLALPHGITSMHLNPNLHKLYILANRMNSGLLCDSTVQVVVESLPATGIAGQAQPRSPVQLSITPNPLRSETRISFNLAQPSRVKAEIADASGRVVATVLANEPLRPGRYERTWHAAAEPSGIYFLNFTACNIRRTEKLVLTK